MERMTPERGRQNSLDVDDEFDTAEDGLLGGEKVNNRKPRSRFTSSHSAATFHFTIFVIYSIFFAIWMFKIRPSTFHGAGVIYSGCFTQSSLILKFLLTNGRPS
jgi:hypothetical protein